MTPFPEMVQSVVSESILGRAEKKELVQFHTKNLFDFADPPHRRIDDYPFGGGFGNGQPTFSRSKYPQSQKTQIFQE